MGELAGNKWLPRDVAKLCNDAGWSDVKNLYIMVAVVGGESDYYDKAVGDINPDGTQDFGLFQLNNGHMTSWGFKTQDLFEAMCFNPPQAVHYARRLYLAGHFGPWAAYANGGYRSHLKTAIVGVANMCCVFENIPPDVRYGK